MIEAYLDNNLGDDLMIKLLVKKFPEHKFFYILILQSSKTHLKKMRILL